MLKHVICFLALSLSSTLVRAAPVHYDESVSGDIFVDAAGFGIGFPLMTFAFDVGTNTVSGSMQVGDPPFPFDGDAFAFIIQDGATLVSAEISLVKTIGNAHVMSVNLRQGAAGWRLGTVIDSLSVNTPGVSNFDNVPQSSGVYQIDPTSMGYISPPGFGGLNYTMTFVVVPEPSSFVLAALGLIGLVVWRRRKP